MIVETATTRQFDQMFDLHVHALPRGVGRRSTRIECCQLHDLKQVPPLCRRHSLLASGVAEEQEATLATVAPAAFGARLGVAQSGPSASLKTTCPEQRAVSMTPQDVSCFHGTSSMLLLFKRTLLADQLCWTAAPGILIELPMVSVVHPQRAMPMLCITNKTPTDKNPERNTTQRQRQPMRQ